jgi:hypothetical protein
MIKTFQKIIVGTFVVIAVFTFAQTTLAQTKAGTTTKPKAPATTVCDTQLSGQLTNAGYTEPLPKYCSTGSLYNKFINLAFYFAGIVAVIMIIYGGYLYMTSQGNAAQTKKGRDVLTWAILGLIVVILAAAIVNAVVNTVVS